MKIQKIINETATTLKLIGRLDTITSKTLETEFESLSGKTDITLDFAELKYISSAGLRVLLTMQQQMEDRSGKMRLINVCEDVKEVFNITGFVNVLRIE